MHGYCSYPHSVHTGPWSESVLFTGIPLSGFYIPNTSIEVPLHPNTLMQLHG